MEIAAFSYQICPERRETTKAGVERNHEKKLKGEERKHYDQR